MERCLYCYKELAAGERDFHKSCSKKIFGTTEAPLLPYTHANIAELAREVIRSQTTLTGVQAKLSLDIAKAGKDTPERFSIVGLWGRYILKPQTEHYPHLPELEDLTIPKWGEWIDVSFLPDEMKGKYKELISERIGRLK